ncbi:MAG: D-glycerate dehydrogenase, partial [Myxococcales bacterium]|nr:D-glycerate dehydrogenase [Myxococcales bacterium]
MSGPALVVVPAEVPRDWLASVDAAEDLEVVVDLATLPEARRPALVGLLSLLTMPIDAALLERLPGLRVVSNMAVGHDNI